MTVIEVALSPEWHGHRVSDIETMLREAGYVTILGQTMDDPDQQRRLLCEIVGTGIAGLIVKPCVGTTMRDLAVATDRDLPVLLIVHDILGAQLPLVALDDHAADREDHFGRSTIRRQNAATRERSTAERTLNPAKVQTRKRNREQCD